MKELKLTEKNIKVVGDKLWISKQYKKVFLRFTTGLDNTPENYKIVCDNLYKLFSNKWNSLNVPEGERIQLEREVTESFVDSFKYYLESKQQDPTSADSTIIKLESLYSVLQKDNFFKERRTVGITLNDIEMYAFHLDRAKQSKNTIKYKITHILACINMFRKLFKLDLLDSRLMDISKYGRDQEDGDIFSENDLKEILEKIEKTNDTELISFVNIKANTGAREGEILALTKDDIDLENNQITINKTITIGGKVKNSPKTDSGNRVIPIIDARFKEFLALVISKTRGKRLFKSSLNRIEKTWYSFLESIGSPKIWLRNIRHSVATFLCRKTNDFIAVAAMLGHSKPSTTFDNYVRVNADYTNLQGLINYSGGQNG